MFFAPLPPRRHGVLRADLRAGAAGARSRGGEEEGAHRQGTSGVGPTGWFPLSEEHKTPRKCTTKKWIFSFARGPRETKK